MAKLLGLDLDKLIGGIGKQFAKVMPENPFPSYGGDDENPFAGIAAQLPQNPFSSLGTGVMGNPFAGAVGGAGVTNPFQNFSTSAENPFGNFQVDTSNPFGNFSADTGNPFGTFGSTGNPFQGMFEGTVASRSTNQLPPTSTAAGTTATGQQAGGMSFAGPATADDNAGITGDQVNQFIASKFGNSPMVGQGQYILDTANKYGVSALMLLGIGWKESGMGTNVGRGNIFGMKDGPDSWIHYGNVQQEIDAAAKNLTGQYYKGKSAAEQMGAWYVGPQKYAAEGLNAHDGTGTKAQGGNGTVQDYLDDFIAPVYAAFGKGLQPTAAPTAKVTTAPITTEGFTFPIANWQGENVPLHWGSEHGGADLFAPIGSSIVAMGNGTVIDAGTNSLGGNTITLRLDNGLIVYMAHMRDAALVGQGQRVQAGQALGYVGDTGNAKGTTPHLHIGIGRDIINGGGPTGGLGDGFGGSGEAFDANGWLNGILNQTRGKR